MISLVMYSFDLFKKPKSIKSVVIPVEFVPETIYIKDIELAC
jgi:hypothetical protein